MQQQVKKSSTPMLPSSGALPTTFSKLTIKDLLTQVNGISEYHGDLPLNVQEKINGNINTNNFAGVKYLISNKEASIRN